MVIAAKTTVIGTNNSNNGNNNNNNNNKNSHNNGSINNSNISKTITKSTATFCNKATLVKLFYPVFFF